MIWGRLFKLRRLILRKDKGASARRDPPSNATGVYGWGESSGRPTRRRVPVPLLDTQHGAKYREGIRVRAVG